MAGGDPECEPQPPDNSIRFTVVDGTSTYSFDTGWPLSGARWANGSCLSIFHGRAEYIPELRVWLGMLASTPYNLCAFDLSGIAIGSCDAPPPPPPLVQVFEMDVNPHEGCSLKNLALVNLGSCRFCIVRFFDVVRDHGEAQVVVLTGVEVAPCDDHRGERRFSMIKHKSERLRSDCIECVL